MQKLGKNKSTRRKNIFFKISIFFKIPPQNFDFANFEKIQILKKNEIFRKYFFQKKSSKFAKKILSAYIFYILSGR